METQRERTLEMQQLLEERAQRTAEPVDEPMGLEAFLEALAEKFHPDRVNERLWHCRTLEEFQREWDALRDPEEELAALPHLDGGNDTFFTDRN